MRSIRKTSNSYMARITRDIKTNKIIYLMASVGILYYIIFKYIPMYGLVIAFKNFNPVEGIQNSQWVGLKHFKAFFNSYYFWDILPNTLLLSLYSILWGFPAPIILALLLNEINHSGFKKTIQTITYLPHFISMVVVCGMITQFASVDGLFNSVIALFGGERNNLLGRPELFRSIFISTDIWQQVGWGSIIYLAALAGISVDQYEAADIDGANRWKKMLHVTLPGILPTIIIMLILRIGRMMNVSFEKVILLYNPITYETADVISSFVYRKGIQEANYSYSSAIGLFNSVINFVLLILANTFSKKFNETSLW